MIIGFILKYETILYINNLICIQLWYSHKSEVFLGFFVFFFKGAFHIVSTHWFASLSSGQGRIWFIGYDCREHREICLITNQRAKASPLLKWPACSGFHSETVIQMSLEWLIKFIRIYPRLLFQQPTAPSRRQIWSILLADGEVEG